MNKQGRDREREMKGTAKGTELEKWVGALPLILTSPLWSRAQGTGESEVQIPPQVSQRHRMGVPPRLLGS